jgi:branched-chain amino acid transport system substrate-binding protein
LKLRKRDLLGLLALLIAAFALLAAGCGGDDDDEAGGGAAATTDSSDGGDGGGGQTLKIVSDLPLQGSDREQTAQMNNAIRLVLEQAGNMAGDFNIEFEAFDDSTAAKGAWDEAVCASNARQYAEDESVVGVIGTYNSGCAAIEIPILNEGGLAMISPANTAVGLTHTGPGSGEGEPEKYYPSGTRNYARVVASDDLQGKTDAEFFMNDLGVTKVFILDDKEQYGKGVADAFEQAANDIGLEVVGHEGWDKAAQNYTALMTQIEGTGADGIFLGGISTNNGGQLVRDKVAVLGDNETVKLMGSDGFVLTTLFEEAGPENAEGMYGSAPVVAADNLTGAGEEFIAAFEEQYPGESIQVYTAYAAACAQALLDAIGRSDGSREDIIAKMLEVDIEDGITGPIRFNENGDPAEGRMSIFIGQDGDWAFHKAAEVTAD